MPLETTTLEGQHIRLEPLKHHHAGALAAASAVDPSLYQWSTVPQGLAAADAFISNALAGRDAGTALPFVTIRKSDNVVLGSTRFWLLERWNWPADSPHFGQHVYDTCELGYTWLTASAVRTAANTEAKLLMLTHAFEVWNVNSVSICTDERNQRSAAAIQRIGGKLEGVLRSHRMAVDFIPRNTLRFSIIASEWPETKRALQQRLAQH